MSSTSSSAETPAAHARIHPAELALLASVFVVAACGLVYELAAGALASYLLGDSVLQFSTIIGSYLFAMGIGSWLSKYIRHQLVAQFLRIELLVAFIGGLMPALLFTAHSSLPASAELPFRVMLYGLVGVIGILAGLEIPLVMRILKAHFAPRWALSDLVSQVLTFDYLGALMVAVAFPLLFVPHLGLVRTGLFFGLLNAAVAVWVLFAFRADLRRWGAHAAACFGVVAVLIAAMAGADRLTTWAEDSFYGSDIVVRESSDYQRVVVTAGPAGVRLYLNGNLQFHSRDEYRYHEVLVHPALAAHGAPRRVLVLGGGDGLAVREVLKHPSVEQVTLVELDPHITRLFANNPVLRQLNADALASPKLTVVNTDAYTWLEANREVFDVIVVDFPDPTNFSIGKLYTTSFYQRADQALAAGGYLVVQTTSPLFARKSYWTVVSTIEAVGLQTTPLHVHVPSFGEWGFVIASRRPWQAPEKLPPGLRFLTVAGLPALLQFPPDMARVPAEPNRLSNQALVATFEEEWGRVK
ncbi:polyamine aminopropyltransferase [Rubrivivax rivuli]|uniref:Polyamine aminopropyltransferase n=1 Tax=Rubrivivax rivuli TaxID=1862385 RepID=A0A437RQK5_9BURK|nr:polyamine aminopropyltransferase [Rubrivivax rivuli]RVU49067.1 polyamine aminopropyltransferase [Rubrivivax rivuli]